MGQILLTETNPSNCVFNYGACSHFGDQTTTINCNHRKYTGGKAKAGKWYCRRTESITAQETLDRRSRLATLGMKTIAVASMVTRTFTHAMPQYHYVYTGQPNTTEADTVKTITASPAIGVSSEQRAHTIVTIIPFIQCHCAC